MREIKFRAWDRKEKRMIKNYHETYLWEDLNSGKYDVMQYTGFHDKNGKEIYEGDILKDLYGDNHCKFCGKSDPNNLIYIVQWKKETGEWDAETREPLTENGNNLFPDRWSKWVEVIGNIYENPELLEDK